jgi:hypothetical protein
MLNFKLICSLTDEILSHLLRHHTPEINVDTPSILWNRTFFHSAHIQNNLEWVFSLSCQKILFQPYRVWNVRYSTCKNTIQQSTDKTRLYVYSIRIYRVNVQYIRIFYYAVPHNNRYTLLLENIRLSFVLQQVLFLSFFPHPMPYSIPSFLNVTVLHYNVFTKAVYSQTSDWLIVG